MFALDQSVFHCSVAFGMRKALQAEQGKTDMEGKVESYFNLNVYFSV